MRLAAAALAATTLLTVLVLTAGAAEGSADPHTSLVVTVELEGAANGAHARHFTLECGPTGGTIPHADDLCGLIARHPVLLDPPDALAMCDGIDIPYVTVHGVSGGKPVDFAMDGCSWPGGDVALTYYSAAQDDASGIEKAAGRLHCSEDPSLTGEYVPFDDVLACLNGS